ncbi:hypothetical protein Tco_0990493 [Tanacetum coccineum]|uniref:Uncharacterized protein n=1 Tax=Tanacetum coccineum TaxID=301880 RepID=A0ABQ4ZGL6_9ASTR
MMESVTDALVEKVNARVAKLKLGQSDDHQCDITPVVSGLQDLVDSFSLVTDEISRITFSASDWEKILNF